MSSVKQFSKILDLVPQRMTLSIRDVILLAIGIVIGSIASVPLQYSSSNLPIIASPHSQPSTSTLPSYHRINSYNSRIVTQCPHSANYSKGDTILLCGSTCEQNYTAWAASGITTGADPTDDENILRMRGEVGPYFVSQQPNPIDVLDVGANTGIVTGAILALRKGHRVLAVEPVEENLNQLCKISQLNHWLSSPLLTIVHAAASDRIGNKTIYVPIGRGDNSAFTTVAATKAVGGSTRPEEIFLLDGDGLLKETGFKPRIIKIDTQGHELFVLRGLKDFLKNAGKGEVIVIAELHIGITEASGVNVSDIYELMVEELGYSVTCSREIEYDNDGKVVNIMESKLLTKKKFTSRPGCLDVYYVKL